VYRPAPCAAGSSIAQGQSQATATHHRPPPSARLHTDPAASGPGPRCATLSRWGPQQALRTHLKTLHRTGYTETELICSDGREEPLHLVWDWNGTVLNDFDVGIRSTNSSFRDAGLQEITTATYQSLLRTPVRNFYAAVLDRDPSDEECDFLVHAFRAYYLLHEKQAALSSGLPHLFRRWHRAGHTQSLLSLFPHYKLVLAV
jgi:hypothetical protein